MKRIHPSVVYVLYNGLYRLGLGFIMVAYVPWLAKNGLTLAEIAVVNGVFCIGTALAEVPTGMLADGKSRSWSIRVGLAVIAGATLAFSQLGSLVPDLLGVTAQTFGLSFDKHRLIVASAILCELGVAIGQAFMSGADQAWIADALKSRGEQDELGKTFGTAAAVSSAGMLIGGLCGGLIASFSMVWAWYASASLMLLSLILCCFMINVEGEPMVRVSETEALRLGWRVMRRHPILKWAAAAAAIYALVHPFNMYWTLKFEPNVGMFGLSWVWVVVYGALVMTGWLIRRYPQQNHEVTGITVAMSLAGLGIAVAGMSSGLLIPVGFIVISEIGRGAYAPLLSTLTQRHVESEYRATYGSLQSLVSMMSFGIVVLTLYVALGDRDPNQSTINMTWIISGSLLVVGSALLWLRRPKI